jgi:hypothetical protein
MFSLIFSVLNIVIIISLDAISWVIIYTVDIFFEQIFIFGEVVWFCLWRAHS